MRRMTWFFPVDVIPNSGEAIGLQINLLGGRIFPV